MLNDEICRVRNKLNTSIENGDDYDKIYQISVELDQLIAQFYNEEEVKKIVWYQNINNKDKKCDIYYKIIFRYVKINELKLLKKF